jgi:hypothetical protein
MFNLESTNENNEQKLGNNAKTKENDNLLNVENKNENSEQNFENMTKKNVDNNNEDNNINIETTNYEETNFDETNFQEIKIEKNIEEDKTKKKEIKPIEFKKQYDENQIISMDTVTDGNSDSEDEFINLEGNSKENPLRTVMNYYLDLDKSVRKWDYRAANLLKYLLSVGFTLASVVPYAENGPDLAGCTIAFEDKKGEKCNPVLGVILSVGGVTINLAVGYNTIEPFFQSLFGDNTPIELKEKFKDLQGVLNKKTTGQWTKEYMLLGLLTLFGLVSGVSSGASLPKPPKDSDKFYDSLAYYLTGVTLSIASNGVMNIFPLQIMMNVIRENGIFNTFYACMCDYRSKNEQISEKKHKEKRDEFFRRIKVLSLEKIHDGSIQPKLWGLFGYGFTMPDEYKNVISQIGEGDRFDRFWELMVKENNQRTFSPPISNNWFFSLLDSIGKSLSWCAGASIGLLGTFLPYQIATMGSMNSLACNIESMFNNQTFMSFPCNETIGNITFFANNTVVGNNTFINLDSLMSYFNDLGRNIPHYGLQIFLASGPGISLALMCAYFAGNAFKDVGYVGIKNFFSETWKAITKRIAPRYLPRDMEYAPYTYIAFMVLGGMLAANSYATTKNSLGKNSNSQLFEVFPWLLQVLMYTVYVGSPIFNFKNWSEVGIEQLRNFIVNTWTNILKLSDKVLCNCCGISLSDDTQQVVEFRTALANMIQFIENDFNLKQLMECFNDLTDDQREAATGSKDKIETNLYKLEKVTIESNQDNNEEKEKAFLLNKENDDKENDDKENDDNVDSEKNNTFSLGEDITIKNDKKGLQEKESIWDMCCFWNKRKEPKFKKYVIIEDNNNNNNNYQTFKN